eukprot:420923-Pyramimonas_sp.AAC.1
MNHVCVLFPPPDAVPTQRSDAPDNWERAGRPLGALAGPRGRPQDGSGRLAGPWGQEGQTS